MSDIQYKSRRNYIEVGDAGHLPDTPISATEFDEAFKNWEIRRGFRSKDQPATPLRGRPLLYRKRAENLAAAQKKKLARRKKKV